MAQHTPILLVDDEPDVLTAYRMMLEESGYEVHTASTIAAALEELEAAPVEACLVDMRLRSESGLDLCARLLEADACLKVLMITAYPTLESAVQATKLGVFDYVAKTEDPREILRKLERALKVRREELAARMAGTPGATVNLLLVCNHHLVGAGLEQFCQTRPRFRLVQRVRDLAALRPLDFSPTVDLMLVCDGCHPETEALPSPHPLFPGSKVVLINSNRNEPEQEDLLRSGLAGFLEENLTHEEMERALLSIHQGDFWAPRSVLSRVLQGFLSQAPSRMPRPQALPSLLSRRELQVLEAMAAGLSNSEIGLRCHISENTVKVHVHHILKKLSAHSRTQAVLQAIEARII